MEKRTESKKKENKSSILFRCLDTEHKKFVFGHYPSRFEDGSLKMEPIVWEVIKEENGLITAISQKVLDSLLFDEESENYGSSYIRRWLNKDFLNTAFDEEEKKLLLPTSKGDKVAILSDIEAEDYFDYDESRMKAPTAYALSKKIYVQDGYSPWWIYEYWEGGIDHECLAVSPKGQIDYSEVFPTETNIGVAPVIRIKAID